MPDDNRYDDEKNSKRGGEFRVPPKTWIVWIAIFGGIISLMMLKEKFDNSAAPLKQYDFLQKVECKLIATASINYGAQSGYLTEIVGEYYKTDREGNVLKNEKVPFRTKARLT